MTIGFLWLVPLFPLLACAVNGLVGQRSGKSFTNLLAVGSVWVSFAFALYFVLVYGFHGAAPNSYPVAQLPFEWFSSGSFHLKLGLLLDPLSAVMILIVTGVGGLIHVYSMGYMDGDPGYNRYFCYLNLFTFSMLLLVLADSFLLMFVGWELVGLCSYLLIGFWYERQSATNAGKKAFIVNRVGDWAFVVGIILTFVVFAPRMGGGGLVAAGDGLAFQQVFSFLSIHNPRPETLTGSLTLVPVIALLLFIGAMGKSAQLPILHIWLPDAMEGPTPVSALIHAATMVTAGVYMVCRCHPFYLLSPSVMTFVAWIGGITAFAAATIAVVQTDIKRVLAYSTISQIGYMFIGAGSGAFSLSIFHLMTHAFFKAMLFLGAGAVIHALHNEQDMRKMGGLHRRMPAVSWMMGMAVLAIAGIPPWSGFWSKDYILGAAAQQSIWLWALGTLSAFITAFYMTRLWCMTFAGQEHWQDALAHHDSPAKPRHVQYSSGQIDAPDVPPEPPHTEEQKSGGHGADLHPTAGSMMIPMAVLAVLSVIGGLAALLPHFTYLNGFLDPVFADMPAQGGEHAAFLGEIPLMIIGGLVAFAGVGLGAWAYWRDNVEPKRWMKRNPGLYDWLANAWRIDYYAHALFADGGEQLAQVAYEDVETRGIDRGGVGGIALGIYNASRELRIAQSGVVVDYALAMAFGVAILVVYFLLR